MKRVINISLVFVLSLILFTSSGGSKKDELISLKQKLEKEIKLTNELISKTKKGKESGEIQLKLINSKITTQQKLINAINEEIKGISKSIDYNEQQLWELRSRLEAEKKIYGEIVYRSYLNNSENQTMMFLLASSNVNQIYDRYKYIEQFRRFRKKKILIINALESHVNKKIAGLKDLKSEKSNVLNSLLEEKSKYYRQKRDRENLVVRLSREEKKLRKNLEEKKKQEKELLKKIEAIIKEEAKKNKYAKLTPEQRLISGGFSKNKGRLPWPTIQGVVTSDYGKHWHPVVRGVTVDNEGIDISTTENAMVRTIYDGEVTNVFSIKGTGLTVMIKHGSYWSVYNNLHKVKVKSGEKVSSKQIIGEVLTNKTNGSSTLHFRIYKGQETLNPKEWLSK